MKISNTTFLATLLISIFTLSSCDDDSLSDLERDIVGEWVVDDYIFSGDNLAENGTFQDMHMIFENNFDIEVSWFEGGDFFVVDGRWEAFEDESRLSINLDNRVFFFCNDDDIDLNIFFFAFDMELDSACNNNDWMEIQLERL